MVDKAANFLSEDNYCGQLMLKLVSKGSAILCELQRLGDSVPKVFYGSLLSGPKDQKEAPSTKEERKKYEAILFDFEYLKNVDASEEKIQRSQDTVDLDEAFKDTYFPLLERFYILFDRVNRYYVDIMRLVREIDDAVYVQYTIENVLQNAEGKKLMGEMFYQFGCMLLLLEELFVGPVREKIIVSYSRYKGGQHAIDNINDVVKLCKDTGYLPARLNGGVAKRPENYPEEFFARFPVASDLIKEIVTAIKEDDIYSAKKSFPSQEHRSLALSTQGAVIYVLLYWTPQVLVKENATMREIVDKHFHDYWVLPWFIGYTIDLSEAWVPYRAAKLAIGNTIQEEIVESLVERHADYLDEHIKKCKEFLVEGVLTEDFVLDKINKILDFLRYANATIRWLLLQRRSASKKIRDVVVARVKQEDLLALILNVSQMEFIIKKMFERMIESKQERWDGLKAASREKIDDIVSFFNYNKAKMRRSEEGYSKWFEDIRTEIDSLTYTDSTYAGRKIQQLMKALEDVEQYHLIENNIQIKQYLHDIRNNLRQMIRIVNVKVQFLQLIATISDFAYSWQVLKEYLKLMQDQIKASPANALLLRATFLKLSSIMNSPMVRIIQANSPDLLSVSKYYSGELMRFVKEVLQIIPTSVFETLEEIIVMLATRIKKIPQKIPRGELKDYAQYEERTVMANHVHQICVYTQSILAMETYLVGVIEVNPKAILEDGIRRELIKLIYRFLDKALVFTANDTAEYVLKLNSLSDCLEGFKKALEYIQDFLNIYGLKIWQEEFDKLINVYIDIEANLLLRTRLTVEELDYEDYIPMPTVSLAGEGKLVTFLGRLVRVLMDLTDPKKVTYVDFCLTFYDIATQKETMSMRHISLLRKCVGVAGLNGIDKLLSFLVIGHLRIISKTIRASCDPALVVVLTEIAEKTKSLNNFVENIDKLYANARRLMKNLVGTILPSFLQIGQIIVLRKLIALELNNAGRINSSLLYDELANLNRSILLDVYQQKHTPEKEDAENLLILETSRILTYMGFTEPLKKIYFTPDPIDHLPIIAFVFILNTAGSVMMDDKLKMLVRRNKKEEMEPSFMLLGLTCFLNQFHASNHKVFFALVGQYLRSLINFNLLTVKDNKVLNDLLGDVFMLSIVLDELMKLGDVKRRDDYVPIDIVTHLNSLK